jgi:hypothetical protein
MTPRRSRRVGGMDCWPCRRAASRRACRRCRARSCRPRLVDRSRPTACRRACRPQEAGLGLAAAGIERGAPCPSQTIIAALQISSGSEPSKGNPCPGRVGLKPDARSVTWAHRASETALSLTRKGQTMQACALYPHSRHERRYGDSRHSRSGESPLLGLFDRQVTGPVGKRASPHGAPAQLLSFGCMRGPWPPCA